MGRRIDKVSQLASLLRGGQADVVRSTLKKWAYSEALAFGLRRDLAIRGPAPGAKIPLIARPQRPDDVPALFDPGGGAGSGEDAYLRENGLLLVRAGITTQYVAVTADGRPCYTQWLIAPGENHRVRRFFGDLFPWLAPDEVLLEFAYTPEPFRGLGVMACAMAQIAEKGVDSGARRALTFVASDNTPALKGCERAGFSPYLVRREQWRLFRRRTTFERLPALPLSRSSDRADAGRLPLQPEQGVAARAA